MKVSKAAALGVQNLKNHQFGKCNICGNWTIFICIDVDTVRNNMYCPICKSSSRKRHVAKLLIDKVNSKVSSLAEISSNQQLNNLRIYNADVNDAFYQKLHNLKYYYCSSYIPNVQPGTEIEEKVFCQDIENLTFAEQNFDIVITEDVFEHIRNYQKGFQEVYRVLKKDGYHIFTVPCFFDKPTLVRVDTSGNEDIHLLPPEYHGDKIRGKILAYRTFGIDIFEMLEKIGFQTTVDFSNYVDQRYGIYDSYVFCSQKL